MSDIEPKNHALVFGTQVNQGAFKCCPEPDGMLARCPSCGHIWGICCECDSWTPDLRSPSTFRFFYNFLPSNGARGRSCPHCMATLFEEVEWYAPGVVDRYLPSPEQVRQAGYSAFLADEASGEA